ncbi:phosphotransferase KptA/Tpt1 [Cystobacter fuscus DSM 2262]|uniref:Phosphotransferase KptA/Tpt1 n=1 Tax=Cystobacter fuscus (strain ATCC 25194 / DSM 2262 / NBRC 100088 / M29) TaxID=1242864 RepID=S9QPC6_CYSF2|nr:tRNA 2'-phosphotransferase [Cystobacter fuscus]EPX63144.1 phosphotransferase KptA/Tpt1 [Cystobacter fuscus DSM 2262]
MASSRRPEKELQALARKSKKLSWLLRHGAREMGLAMDSAGFALIGEVLRMTGLSREELDEVVAENNKSRYEVRGKQVRAVQGHSLEGTPVTLDGLERSWDEVLADAPLYHGTSVAAARAILSGEGIHSAARTHVHLAAAVDSKVGKRAGVDVLLVISPARLRASGLRIFRAPNGVLLARAIPATTLVDVLACNGPGSSALAELKRRLGTEASSPAPARGE